ncbi:hypothetical protein HU200_006750 [Digitaria exilis]|uniref:Ancillary SecYEG translocon subunit/Cell division coordinator CpoB TPR domain-containing protein n=1 Tax=Digitaria exilis TaxID=1010633 RepID=A0A835FPP3_9POAL|nr:hypothetical protein HU200_006750 [Digitaria exilis]CAB3488654.1 unnamed protein product [Digitaria exilis]
MSVAVAVSGVTTAAHRRCCLASAPRRSQHRCRRPAPPRASGAVEVRVCTSRTCARQGAREVLAALAGLAPPRVDVGSCGCLGRCGAGPNVAASVAGSAAVFGHVGTAGRAAQLLEHLLGAAEFDASAGLAALAAREKAELALEKGNADEAEALLNEVIGLNASGGLHLVYSSRSKARLAIGNISGALEDAEEAIRVAPKFHQAHLLRGDALLAMGEYCAAEDAYAKALDLHPSIRRSKSFKARLERLREELVSAANP